MSLNKKIQWRDKENVIEIVKPSMFKFFWHHVLVLLILFTLSFFSFWLIRQGLYGLIVASTSIVASLALLIDARNRRNANYWILTNERLIDVERHGIFSDTVSSIDYENIVDVHIRRRGFNSRLFGLGDLVADTESEDYAVSLSSVRHPQIILEWIMQLSRESGESRDFQNTKILLKHFYKSIPRLSEIDIIEIKNRLDNRLGKDDENI